MYDVVGVCALLSARDQMLSFFSSLEEKKTNRSGVGLITHHVKKMWSSL